MISAQQALDIGLVNQVVEPAQVLDTALTWAQKFRGGPKLALAAAKRSIDTGVNVDLKTGLTIESTEFAALFATQDQKSGMNSFVKDGPGKATFVGS